MHRAWIGRCTMLTRVKQLLRPTVMRDDRVRTDSLIRFRAQEINSAGTVDGIVARDDRVEIDCPEKGQLGDLAGGA